MTTIQKETEAAAVATKTERTRNAPQHVIASKNVKLI